MPKPRRITRSPDPLRVLTVARWYPSHDSPGRGSFVADLVRAVGAAGVDGRVVSFDRVLVRGRLEERDQVLAEARGAYEAVATPAALFVTPPSNGSRLSRAASGVPVARLAVARRPGSGDAAALVEDHLAAILPFLDRLIEEWRPDVIHAHTGLPDGVVAAEAGRQLRIPVVVTEHASTIERDLADPAAREQYRRLLEPGVGLFAVSPSLAVRLATTLEVPVTRIGVLPVPVADGSFPLADPAGREGSELLWVGSLGAHKGVDVLLHALGKLLETHPDLHLRIVGVERTAGDLENLEELATAIGVRSATSFDGWLTRDQVAAAMARAAVFVHPSPSETFGVAAGEAILTGLPVAARPSGGVPWIVELSGGFGQIADGGEAKALAAAIEHVLAGDLPVDAATARGLLVEALGEEAVARQTIAVYRQSISAAREKTSTRRHADEAAGVTAAGTPSRRSRDMEPGAGRAPGGEKDARDPTALGLEIPAPGPGRPAPTPGQTIAPTTTMAAVLPAILVATGRDHALPLVTALPADLRARLTLVVPAWREGATEPPNTIWPIRLIEAVPVEPRKPRPTGRGPLAGLRRALDRPAPTAEELLTSAMFAAVTQIPVKARTNPGDAAIEMVAIDAPAAALIARLAGKGVRLAPGALRWLADCWNAKAGDALSSQDAPVSGGSSGSE